MPHCENEDCDNKVNSTELRETPEGKLVCGECSKVVSIGAKDGPKLFLGRDYDYGFSYDNDSGIKSHARLGGAKISFEVSQDELRRTFGREK